ncbi:hypothetical protein [Pedobacter paludis]|uniref:TerB family tellurite resistance protein n=1 Tax=Pedobacter paludis TaxID=2203212 RepID=A0A317F5Z8_9SPHI|nr:hypothetical protein [Pedobacter paludis]PWS33329.1 hypothetical protein DF947_01505 [Pedobacter paludis]
MRSIKRFRVLVLLMALGSGSVTAASAQMFSEWFRQKKTQQKYLLEQIAALEVYLGYAKKGYRIATEGWGFVHELSSGEMNLHDAFFKGLKLVNPVIKADSRVSEMLVLEVDMLKVLQGLRSAASGEGLSAYVSSVSALVKADCLSDLEELVMVVSSGRVSLSDDVRLSRLDSIYQRMQERLGFVREFDAQVRSVLRQEQMEQDAIKKLRKYYEID